MVINRHLTSPVGPADRADWEAPGLAPSAPGPLTPPLSPVEGVGGYLTGLTQV
jgi:hypothetical protein